MSNPASIIHPRSFKYHKFVWQDASKTGMAVFLDDSGRKIRLYKRKYDNQGAFFYMSSHVFPTLFIYSCGFVSQLYDYCQTVKKKFTKKSIALAFSNCPNLSMLIKDGRFEYCHLEDISINGDTKKCLAVCYPSFLFSRRMMYNRLSTMEEILKEEVRAINKYELRGKWDTVKKIGAGALKVAAKVGVALVAGAVGGNLDIDLPDFDFGSSLPDVDFDFDLDLDTDMDLDTGMNIDSGVNFDTDAGFDVNVDSDIDADTNSTLLSDLQINNGQDIAFGASENSDGFIPDGKITMERTISGSKDTFSHYTNDGHDYVKTASGNYVRVDQGNTVTINGVKYDTV